MMKTLAKVFIIIGMICKFYLIFPVVIGIIALNKINNSRSTAELQVIGVLSIIFVSVLGGVFMLLISDGELDSEYQPNVNSGRGNNTPNYNDNQNYNSSQNNSSRRHDNIEGQLEMLEKLYNEGFMTKAEYDERRKKVLDKIWFIFCKYFKFLIVLK